ncbi:superoxide dismutase family protein [Sphingomonas koreensis]
MIRYGCAIAALAFATTACGSVTTPPANTGEPVNAALPIENEALPIDNVAETAETATASLEKADGTAAGSAIATVTPEGLSVSVSVTGITPGQHGVHVHMTGKCEGPAFASAGGHWNPGNVKHGLEAPDGAHAGDMPNLAVASDGTGTLTFVLKSGTLAQLLDADGSAFVVHAGPDDQKTDPSGNSGDRVACGVFAAN